MGKTERRTPMAPAILGITLVLATSAPLLAQGIVIPVGGPVHRGMAGASTAAPLDAIGAMYWNPATISGLEKSELEFGFDLLLPNLDVSSTVGATSGSTGAEPGATPVPNITWVQHQDESPITFGLGLNAVAGYLTNLRADATNPVLTAPPRGLGRVYSEATFFQLTPVVSIAVTENLSVAIGPTITMAKLSADPFVFDAPNANGLPAAVAGTRWHWGGGAQAGIYYIHDECWHLGASIKSPSWMETFRFHTLDAAGAPRVVRQDVDLPMIISLGAAYTGSENLTLALDVRYFDYKNTDGFGDPATFNRAGALEGLDWSSIVSAAVGAQYKLNENLYARAGYLYTQSPIRNSEAFYNIASALHYQHMINLGGSMIINEHVAMNVAYSYVLPATVTGPIAVPGVGPVPGTSVSNQLDVHGISMGISVRY